MNIELVRFFSTSHASGRIRKPVKYTIPLEPALVPRYSASGVWFKNIICLPFLFWGIVLGRDKFKVWRVYLLLGFVYLKRLTIAFAVGLVLCNCFYAIASQKLPNQKSVSGLTSLSFTYMSSVRKLHNNMRHYYLSKFFTNFFLVHYPPFKKSVNMEVCIKFTYQDKVKVIIFVFIQSIDRL